MSSAQVTALSYVSRENGAMSLRAMALLALGLEKAGDFPVVGRLRLQGRNQRGGHCERGGKSHLTTIGSNRPQINRSDCGLLAQSDYGLCFGGPAFSDRAYLLRSLEFDGDAVEVDPQDLRDSGADLHPSPPELGGSSRMTVESIFTT